MGERKKPPKELEPWQKDDAARLKKLYNDAGPSSQDSFGAENGIGSQGMVWQYLNGNRPLNLPAAIKFANGLGVRVSDFSPTLAHHLMSAPPENKRRPPIPPGASPSLKRKAAKK